MMRYALIPLALALLSGCGAELLTATAIQGQLQAQQMSAMKGQIQQAAGQTGQINLERAIQTYRAEKGFNPTSLQVLVPDYLAQLPMKPDGSPYGYDPGSGQLLDGPATSSGGVAEADLQMLADIRNAINQYGTATGFYPNTLDDLYPKYLAKQPRTVAGEAFIYNNKDGYLAHPREGQSPAPVSAPAQRGGGGAMGGAGPMGEVMTGIGMQNQLNSMNQSGASSAGSRMRESAAGIGATGDSRANQAMDQLGL